VATALTFVMMLGVGALFVSWSSQYAQEAYSLLFGEVFGVSAEEVRPILVLGAVSVAAIVVMFRPLMLTSALPEVAEARGVSPRRMELGFLLVMALATSMTVPVVGALLMFSLMIGPAAAARSLTARPARAMTLSVAIALVTVLAARLLRRHHRRRLLPARPGLRRDRPVRAEAGGPSGGVIPARMRPGNTVRPAAVDNFAAAQL
jgi:zinc/manganese transport system permease protein